MFFWTLSASISEQARSSSSMPMFLNAEVARMMEDFSSSASLSFSNSLGSATRSHLLRTVIMGLSSAPSSARTWMVVLKNFSASGELASTIWMRKSARTASSSVALNASTRRCGRFLTNPTVSVRRMFWPSGRSMLLVVVSRVAKSMSFAMMSEPEMRLSMVDLPALV